MSLADYGQNDKNGSQAVDIPFSDVGLGLTPSLDGTLHVRLWHDGPFTVDIISLQVLRKGP